MPKKKGRSEKQLAAAAKGTAATKAKATTENNDDELMPAAEEASPPVLPSGSVGCRAADSTVAETTDAAQPPLPPPPSLPPAPRLPAAETVLETHLPTPEHRGDEQPELDEPLRPPPPPLPTAQQPRASDRGVLDGMSPLDTLRSSPLPANPQWQRLGISASVVQEIEQAGTVQTVVLGSDHRGGPGVRSPEPYWCAHPHWPVIEGGPDLPESTVIFQWERDREAWLTDLDGADFFCIHCAHGAFCHRAGSPYVWQGRPRRCHYVMQMRDHAESKFWETVRYSLKHKERRGESKTPPAGYFEKARPWEDLIWFEKCRTLRDCVDYHLAQRDLERVRTMRSVPAAAATAAAIDDGDYQDIWMI